MTVLIEGYTKEELAALPDLETLAACGDPVIFRVGTAEFLGSFARRDGVLVVELAIVERGGKGVLKTLIDAIEAWSLSHQVTAIEWIVHATNCAQPNPKLIRMLELFQFDVQRLENGTRAYFRRVSINDRLSRRRAAR